MGTKDPRVDTYIAKSADFARPILAHLRAVVHAACPEVVETLKWSAPSFEYKGILCGMAAFKQHCAFGFWKHALVLDGVDAKAREGMGSFGRITRIGELPSKVQLTRYIEHAMQLNDAGVKALRVKTVKKKPAKMHADFAAALNKHKKARATFEAFSPSAQRDYTEWIADAKGDDTRARRLASALEWLAEGKRRNWKYEK